MPISEFEQARLNKLLQQFCDEQGPPPAIRDQVKWTFNVDPDKQSVELFEVRPHFANPEIILEQPFAKAKYIKKSKRWKVYWMPSDMKWHQYPNRPEVASIEEFLKVVKEDEGCCFFG